MRIILIGAAGPVVLELIGVFGGDIGDVAESVPMGVDPGFPAIRDPSEECPLDFGIPPPDACLECPGCCMCPARYMCFT